MKAFTFAFALLLAVPYAFAADEKVMTNEELEAQKAEETTSGEIQMEEDAEYETTDGKEVEVDKDVIGDDEIEVED